MFRPVLYAIVCGSPVARDVGKLVTLAKAQGWDVCVVATPDALKFIDLPHLATLTGHPIRHRYKNPGDPDVLPPADAIVVAPATVNTVNKWAAGIADTLALGLLVEAVGRGLPIVSLPFTNTAMAAHPAFRASMANLREWGVTVLFGDDVMPLHPPGTGEAHLDEFPWWLALDALEAQHAARADQIPGQEPGPIEPGGMEPGGIEPGAMEQRCLDPGAMEPDAME